MGERGIPVCPRGENWLTVPVASGEEEGLIGRGAMPVILSWKQITNQFYKSVTDLKLGVTPKSPKSDYQSSRCTFRTRERVA